MRLHQFAVSGFAYKLTQAQREALLVLLVQMAAIDHDVSVEEEAFLVEWATEWQLPLDLTPEEMVADDALLSCFDSFSAKIIALQELVKLGYQDGHFGDEERAKVQAIASRLGVQHAKVISEINRWARSWYDWHYAGEQMIENDRWLTISND